MDTIKVKINNNIYSYEKGIKLESIASLGNETNAVQESKEVDSKAVTMKLNEYDISVAKQAMEKGYNIFSINVHISENTLLKSARAFLIVKDLEEVGEIIKSEPATEAIENEEFENDKTGEKVQGLTIIVDGKLKQVMDIIIEKDENYNNYTDIVRDSLFNGINNIINK